MQNFFNSFLKLIRYFIEEERNEKWKSWLAIFTKSGPTLASFSFIFGISSISTIFSSKCEKLSSSSDAGIQTHDLLTISLFS